MSASLTTLEPTAPASATAAEGRFLFAGHQTFPLRISWLTKAANAITAGENPFADPRLGTQILGIGKNMVEALHCWVELFGVARFDEKTRQPALTEFGELVFGQKGYDSFLEDDQTLWLLHWHAVTNTTRRFFAWHWVSNVHAEHEFSYDEALRAFKAQSDTYVRPLSETTLRQHLDVFLGTYVQSAAPLSGAVAEDLLESPLAILGLIQKGEPRPGAQIKDATYSVDSGVKHTISDQLFRFSLHDWWSRFAPNDGTCSYRQVCHAENSPGRVFRLPEREIHDRLQRLVMTWPKEFGLTESNNQRQIRRTHIPNKIYSLLRDVYHRSH